VTDLPDAVRRRLDEVFGDVLPEVTRDEVSRDEQRQAPADAAAGDEERLRGERPPHHDRG